MKINNIKKLSNNKKLIASIIAVSVVLLLAMFAYAFYGSGRKPGAPTQPPASSNSSPKTTNTGEPTPSGTTTEPSTNPAASSSVKTGTTTTPPSTTPTSKTVSVGISSTQQTATTYRINTIIYSVESTGTCTLTLTKSGSTTITQTAGVQALPSSSTCKGFDIPMSQLSQGQWQLSLSFSNATDSGIVTQSIEVK